MELDDFKSLKVKTAGILTDSGHDDLNNIMGRIRSYMGKKWKKAIIVAVADMAMAFIYISLSRTASPASKTGFIILAAGFFAGSVYLYLAGRPLSDSAYCRPMTEFLDIAEKRFRFMRLRDWLIVIPLLLILGTGGGMVFVERLSNYTDKVSLLAAIWIVFWIGLCIFAFIVSRKDWEKAYGAIVNEIREMRKSLSAETYD
jgi:hypothetical protein